MSLTLRAAPGMQRMPRMARRVACQDDDGAEDDEDDAEDDDDDDVGAEDDDVEDDVEGDVEDDAEDDARDERGARSDHGFEHCVDKGRAVDNGRGDYDWPSD